MAIVIPYVKQTWTDGSGGGTPVSAARLGWVEEGILDVSQSPAVRVSHSVNQTMTTATNLVVAFDAERFDQAGGVASTMHDTVTNNSRLTCRYAGVYQITGNIRIAFNATGIRVLQIRLNGTSLIGSTVSQAVAASSNPSEMIVTTTYLLAVNDYVELVAYQDSGASLSLLVTANYSPEFMMVRVA